MIFFLLFFTSFSFAEDRIVKIYNNNGIKEWWATAFFISEDKLLTAAHTFNTEFKGIYQYILVNENKITVEILKIDFEADIAIFKYSGKNSSYFEIKKEYPKKHEMVDSIGFKKKEKILSTIHEEIKKIKKDIIECEPDGIKGMSGCPLVDVDGKVVGMFINGNEKTSYFISGIILLNFLK